MNRNSAQIDDADKYDGFEQYVQKRSKRFYIGGLLNSITVDKLTRYVTKRGPTVTMVRIFPLKKSKNKVIVRLNVEGDDRSNLLEQRGFWPRGVTCRPWMSRGNLRKHRANLRWEDNYVDDDDESNADTGDNGNWGNNYHNLNSGNRYDALYEAWD